MIKSVIKKPDKKTISMLFLYLLILPSLAGIMHFFGIIFTYTGSIPIGFYRIVPLAPLLQRGDYVSFCLPDPIANMGLSRGYLNRGACANGSESLIKVIIAVPGDTVVVSTSGMRVNKLIEYIAPSKIIDKNHLPVVRFIKEDTYIAKGYWVYGYGDPRYSWDSRYYGEIPQQAIQHRLVPLWVF